MNGKPTIAVISPANEFASHPVLLALLAEHGFTSAPKPDEPGVCGYVVIGRASEPATLTVPSGLQGKPSCRIVLCDRHSAEQPVTFCPTAPAPVPFRGRKVAAQYALPPAGMCDNGTVIADAGGSALWTVSFENGVRHETVYVSAPWISPSQCVFEQLTPQTLLNVLPLIEWLRELSGWHHWIQAPLRACFMFDDPNLHARTFGYVRFEEIAAAAESHNYHCSFATIPLDAYYAAGGASRIFKENAPRISLLVHGNNHTFRELANPGSTDHNRAQMRQAIERISRLERRAGVRVSRVMAPPHGLCSSAMMSAMSDEQFEAVCVSHGSVRAANPEAPWAAQLGVTSVPVIAGLPVIPRFALHSCTLEQVLISAYMNQPIITVGHHWDLADGLDVLNKAAGIINSLGTVQWADMETLSLTNYRQRTQGPVLEIAAQSRRFGVTIPDGITQVLLQVPWMAPSEAARCAQALTPEGELRLPEPGPDLRFTVRGGDTLVYSLLPTVTPAPECRARLSGRALLRRVLVEGRDRAMPFLPKGMLKRV